MAKASTFVRMQSSANRTPTGRRSATGARKLAQYFALGREKQQQMQMEQRGIWHSENGTPVSHQEALEWVQEQAKEHEFTHQFILSAKHTGLSAQEYCQAMEAGGDLFIEWRLIVHLDSKYVHAHAIAFGNKEIQYKGQDFQQWCRAVRTELAYLQEQQLSFKGQELEQEIQLKGHTLEQQQSAELSDEQEMDRGWGLGM